jgi:protein-disulfide isomerase
MKRLVPFVIIVVVLGGAFGFGYWALYLKHSTPADAGLRPPAAAGGVKSADGTAPAAAKTDAPGAEPPHVRGPANAPVTLEEFGDFQCPPCGAFYPILKAAEADYGSRLRVVFREMPLAQLHQHALAAANAAEAAGLQGKFFEMHDLLYENQASWEKAFDVRPIFEGWATKLGLDLERFKRDQASEAVDARITRDGIRAHALGMSGTPSVFINNQEIPFEQFRTAEGLHAAIDKALTGGKQ